MAKAVILDVLENTIGKYVLNLDPSALNVSIDMFVFVIQSIQVVGALNTENIIECIN